jgi:hypothetical protein
MIDIIDLCETSPNHWRAKYQGNYGIYTIHITTDGEKTVDFSCSCPSSGYPCKHIAMIEDAIAERVAKGQKNWNKEKAGAEKLLKTLSKEELYDFLLRQIQFNPDLTNAFFLEFSSKLENAHQNKYSLVLRRALEAIELNEDDYYYEEEYMDLDILDQWFEKARQHLEKNNFQEAVLIAQACIEEFALWLDNAGDEYSEWVSDVYQSVPFDILKTAIKENGVDVQKLYDYCMTELPKKKYAGTDMYDNFNNLLIAFPAEVSGDAFIKLQDSLLDAVEDKSSYEAKKILQRKIEFYQNNHKPKQAWKLIEENIQISDFRKILVEKKIEKKEFSEAKKLVRDFIDDPQSQHERRSPDNWDDYLLDIAQKEKDVPAIRRISHSFIERFFHEDYYKIWLS